MDPATSEQDELQEIMKALGLNIEDARLYLENAISDIVDIFMPTEDNSQTSEPISVEALSA